MTFRLALWLDLPLRLFLAATLWLLCSALYQLGSAAGGFAPKDAQLWTNPLYKNCVARWTACQKDGQHAGEVKEILAFQPFLYSADIMLPAIELGQRAAWMPMMHKLYIEVPLTGHMTVPPATLRTIAWVQNILGVAGMILIGSILSGIVKRD